MPFKLTLAASQEAHGPQNSPNLLTCHLKVLRRIISKIDFLKFENFFSSILTWRLQQKWQKFLALWVDPNKKIQNLAFKALFWKSERSKSPSTLVFDSPEIFFDLMAQSACPTNMKIHIFYAFLMIFAKKAVCIQEGFLNPGVNQRGLRQDQMFFIFEFFVKKPFKRTISHLFCTKTHGIIFVYIRCKNRKNSIFRRFPK